MVTQSNTEIGAIVLGMIQNVPVSISGITTDLVNQNIYFAEQITGDSIPITAVPEAYQPGVTSLTAGAITSLLESQGIGTETVKLDDISLSKGINTNSATQWREDGIIKLNAIGNRISSYQTWN